MYTVVFSVDFKLSGRWSTGAHIYIYIFFSSFHPVLRLHLRNLPSRRVALSESKIFQQRPPSRLSRKIKLSNQRSLKVALSILRRLEIITVETRPRGIKFSSVRHGFDFLSTAFVVHRNTANVIFLHFIDLLQSASSSTPRRRPGSPLSRRSISATDNTCEPSIFRNLFLSLSFQRRSRTIVVRDRDRTSVVHRS